MPTILFFAINSERVQNKVAQRVTVILSDMFGNHISTGGVRVSWFNRVTIHDLLVTCAKGDTILAAAELTGRLNMLAVSSRNIDIRKVVLNRADIRLSNELETNEINIKFITDRLKSDDATEKKKWNFDIRAIELNDSRFSFKNPLKTYDKPFGMDYADIDVSNVNIVVSNFRLAADSVGGVSFRIRRLSGVEKCGLDLKFLSADFFVNRNNLSFKNVTINTMYSHIEANDISFMFNSFKDFSDGFFSTKVTKNFEIHSSEVAFEDLSHFVQYFDRYSGGVTITGKTSGTVENLRGENIALHFGETTRIRGNFNLNGLPNLRSTFIFADVAELTTCPKDIELIKVERLPNGHVTIPENMHLFETIEFKGNFTGFYDDFVTFGTISTNLGVFSTDLSITPVIGSDVDTVFYFNGRLRTENFELGMMLEQPVIGRLSMSGSVEGSASVRGRFEALIEGNIGSIDMKGYEYRDVVVNGAVNNRTYDGHLSIDEPNVKLDFSGKVDLTESIPSYDFLANVERAHLYNLKIAENDSSSYAAFKIEAEFSGTNIDNLSGELTLNNSLFRRNNREIEINDVLLFTMAIRDTNRFILRSDIFDAEIWGEYQFMKLPESFFSMVKNFAPSWAPTYANLDSLSNNSFRFDARFKDTQKLADFFVNEFSISRGTLLEGVYNPAQRDVRFVLDVPYMVLGKMQWQGFFVNASVENSTFVMEAGSAAFKVNRNLTFDNPTVISRTRGDSMVLNLRWNNWDSILYRGTLNSKIFFDRDSNSRRIVPTLNIFSEPGQMYIANDLWTLTHNGIIVDSTAVKINNLQAIMGNQEILASGVISHREQDMLQIAVKDLDLSALNKSMQFYQLLFGGTANGTSSLSNLYDVPVFVSDILIDDFALNDNKFGDARLDAEWDSYNRSVRMNAEALLDDLQTLKIGGNYFTTDQSLDFGVSLDKVPLSILQPYLYDVISQIDGTVSGDINLNGSIHSPVMNGAIDIFNAAMTLDFTQTRYSFAGRANVENNSIQLRGIELFDRFNNICRITNGYLLIDNFRDISFDLRLQASNLEVLNTTERDNNMFYGLANYTGMVGIRGAPHEIFLEIAGRTERGTQFFIPLSSSEEMSRNSFITFVDHSRQTQQRRQPLSRGLVDITASNEPAPEMRYNVNMNIDVTPDAEVRLIFDARIGDVIRSRGFGNLNINITNTNFDMRGTYTIEEGDYLFTLRNVLSNKHFTIENGGVITWSGNPFDALLSLRAIYIARPSLYLLMRDENFRRTVPVECILHITNVLSNPNIRFELEMPNVSQEVRSFLSAATSSEEEMTRQFLSLLAFGHFFPDPNLTGNGMQDSGIETVGMGFATVSEILSNQLSYMISQMGDWDFSFGVRPGASETGGHNWDVDVGRDWWNFHANYEVTTENENIGEFTLEMKLPNTNKLKFKVFNRANATYLSQNPYTQGIGLLFREDFNQFRDFFRKRKPEATKREDDADDVENEQVSAENEGRNQENAFAERVNF